jgi:hypothetical protein
MTEVAQHDRVSQMKVFAYVIAYCHCVIRRVGSKWLEAALPGDGKQAYHAHAISYLTAIDHGNRIF